MQKSDFLVIGGGLAGLAFALQARRRGSVTVLAKGSLRDSNTTLAQGGVAAVWAEEDSPEAHAEDTIRAGAGLCRREVVEACVREGPARVRELMELGVSFSRGEDGELDLGREGGHSRRRVLHVKDSTGAAFMDALEKQVAAAPDIQLLEGRVAVDLITANWLARRRSELPVEPNLVLGAYVLDRETGEVEVFAAKVVVICTGGAGKVYLYTSNPDVATGDGVAMAWRAGARVANMEFIQFHPTCLYHPRAKNFLITEAMRGEGGILRRVDGTPFMEAYHSMKELAPRDVVARAIDSELKRTGDESVFLDMTMKKPGYLRDRFPGIHRRCLELGIDITSEPIPVVPAAHYTCGGVRVDLNGESSIANLFALGEAACTGLHGANRLASNSLLEILVFVHRAAEASGERLASLREIPDLPPWDHGDAVDSDELVVVTQTWDEIRRFMWNYVGIVRTTRRLERAWHRFLLVRDEIRNFYWDFKLTKDLVELRNLSTVAGLVVKSALRRRESRGLHFNQDTPDPDPRFLGDTVLERTL